MTYFSRAWSGLPVREAFVRDFCSKMDGFTLYDLGSAGGTPPPFVHLLPHIEVVNFEPDPRSDSEPHTRTIPVAIGPESHRTVFLNKRPTTSSLLRPNRMVTDRYDWNQVFHCECGDIFETVQTIEVDTVALDRARSEFGLPGADFVKIDVQGLTVEVLNGASGVLKDALGVIAEVEFIPVYEGQFSFDETHRIMSRHGFELFELSNVCRWQFKTALRPRHPRGQQTFCDFLYMRSIDAIGESGIWDAGKARKQVLLFLLFNMPDVAAAYYERFVARGTLPEDAELEGWICEWSDVAEMMIEMPAGSGSLQDGKLRESRLTQCLLRMRWEGLKPVHRQVCLFGAGSHSRWLLDCIKGAKGPEVVAILDDRSELDELEGIPVMRPGALDTPLPIVLSTDVHQQRMRARCHELFGTDRCTIDLYEGCPPGPYPKNV